MAFFTTTILSTKKKEKYLSDPISNAVSLIKKTYPMMISWGSALMRINPRAKRSAPEECAPLKLTVAKESDAD
jgi:hypothetical protein